MIHLSPPKGYTLRPVKYGPYSPSRLIVAKCAQRFFGQYIRKDKSIGSTLQAARGNAIHHVLAKITEAIIANEKVPPSQLQNWTAEAIGLYPEAYEQVDLVRGAALAYLAKPSPYILKSGTDCEKAFAIALYEEDSFIDDTVKNRVYVAVPYAGADGFPNPAAFFGGRLDQVNVDDLSKTVTIVDHKSTPSANKNEDHNFQMGAYAWLVSLFYPGYQMKTVIHYAHPDLSFYGAPTYWSQEDLNEFELYIQGRIWAIEDFQDYPAIPGSPCDYCHMVQECPTNLALLEQRARGPIDLNVRSFADLPRLAGNLRTVGALYDELNKALKKGIEVHAPKGGVSVEGMWYGFKKTEESVDWVSTDLKIREESAKAKQLMTDPTVLTDEEKKKYELQAKLPDLAAVLKHWGVEPAAFKEWQNAKLKQLWRLDKPGMLEMLKQYVVTDSNTRFGGHKN